MTEEVRKEMIEEELKSKSTSTKKFSFKIWLQKLIRTTRVRGNTHSVSTRHGKVMGSMLGHGTLPLILDARYLALNRIIGLDTELNTL